MKLYSIDTELFKLDGGAMFGVVPKTLWNKLLPADDNNLCTLAMRLLLIEDEGRLILIDTGIGNKQDEKFFSHYYLDKENTLDKSLSKYGFSKDDITDVFLTHLHFDHVGGAVDLVDDKLIPAFKNATYWSNETHCKWATQPNAREKASFLKENILPLQESGKLQFLRVPYHNEELLSFTKNISIRFSYGHTKAMMLPQINYKTKTIVYMADLIPTAAHFSLPYIASYDVFPLDSMTEKESFLNEALGNNYILFFEHDATVECCTIQKNEKNKIVIKEQFSVSDI
ncbi:MBL fold metallo-hydrolase [Arachidicoccus ginsenosidimutans]|uniref:MBL fold metallo-hydrolase n=1 Tax=Arachidicoccus sp. BS20 TaxID=1850526 RepID=UPI0007F05BB6|nr:MBL fold metallo-hydrolase [Arachidicoccus sp. BS20]ANI89477.1 MBL fold metallo-hydrolase [Arachidicoccus sp. BS20]